MDAIVGFTNNKLLIYVIIYNTDIAMTSCCEYTCISSSYFPLNYIGPYPGFRWDTVHFLLSSWYTTVLWIQHENNVGNELILR